jgi:hypothetical protein
MEKVLISVGVLHLFGCNQESFTRLPFPYGWLMEKLSFRSTAKAPRSVEVSDVSIGRSWSSRPLVHRELFRQRGVTFVVVLTECLCRSCFQGADHCKLGIFGKTCQRPYLAHE